MYTADITSTTAVTCGPKQHESHQNVQNIINSEILPDSLYLLDTKCIMTI